MTNQTDNPNPVAVTKKRAPYRETKRLKAEERNRLILEAGRDILINEGFAALTVRHTAEKCGIRQATLQYYYKTRDLLFQAIFESALADEKANIDRLLNRVGNEPGHILKARITGHFEASSREFTSRFFYQLWARASLDDYMAEKMDDFYMRHVKLMTDLITGYNPALSKNEAKKRALFALSTLEGATVVKNVERRSRVNIRLSKNYTIDNLMEFFSLPPSGRS